MSKLEAIAAEGFTSTAIEAAINTIEFSLRENNTGSFPRGLSLMLRAMSSWIYDKDPFQPLQWTTDLEHFKVPTCYYLWRPCAAGATVFLAGFPRLCPFCGSESLSKGCPWHCTESLRHAHPALDPPCSRP